MKCDERGNIWVTGPRGVWVFAPDGEHLGVVEIPEGVGNIHWGGPDWRLDVRSRLDVALPFRTRSPRRREPFMTRRRSRWPTSSWIRSAPRSMIQDMQNDVIIEGGAFAESGSPEHANEQNVVENSATLADACRAKGVPVDPRPLHRRGGRAGPEAERAALPGAVRRRGALVRGTLGRRAGRRPRAEAGRLRRREDAHERLAGHEARAVCCAASASTR